MRKTLTIYLKVIKVNIPKHRINRLLKVSGILGPKDLAKMSHKLAEIEAAENKLVHVKSIVGRLLLKSYDKP
jgi:hypothetical protein